jgi:hypothetical protein
VLLRLAYLGVTNMFALTRAAITKGRRDPRFTAATQRVAALGDVAAAVVAIKAWLPATRRSVGYLSA